MNETPPAPTLLDLFTGIGGFSYAFEAEGFRLLAHAETDPAAATVLAAHWPQVPNLGDVTKIDCAAFLEQHGTPDVLTGGVPCQPASLLGARRGPADSRWLWPATLRIASELRPRFCLFENPPALLTLESGRAFNGIVSGLAALGYDSWWDIIPAAAVGAGHLRERLFLFAAYCDHARLEGYARHVSRSCQGWQCRTRAIGPVAPPLVRALKCPATEWLKTESPVVPLVHGLPAGLVAAALRCVGNAVVPQTVQIYARAIRQMI